jgi:hypothetical protein
VANKNNRSLFGGNGSSNVSDWIDAHREAPRQDALGNKIPEPEEELHLIEKEMQEVKMAFELYFMGQDRKSPVRRRDLLWERLRRLKNADIKMTTGLKFRLEQVYSKLGVLDRGWSRSLLERESGTYSRDVFKMKLHQAERAREVKPKPVEQPKRPSMLTDGQLRTLFNTYVMARQRTNEPTENMTLEGLSRNLDRQVPQLLKQYECKAVDFKVVIKNGKAMLKAVPRK